MLPSGELLIINISQSDSQATYRCRTHHRLTQETIVSNNVGRIQLMTGKPELVTQQPASHSPICISRYTSFYLSVCNLIALRSAFDNKAVNPALIQRHSVTLNCASRSTIYQIVKHFSYSVVCPHPSIIFFFFFHVDSYQSI